MTARWAAGCVAITIAAAPVAARSQGARLRGRVFDSVAAMPLAGARVELVNAADRARIVVSTVSDSLGMFAVDGLARGHYIAGFLHPMLDSLGLALSQRTLDVTADGEVQLDLAVPAPERLENALCGRALDTATSGVILGYVLNSHSFAPVQSATVMAQWDEISFGKSGVIRQIVSRKTAADAEGWFSLCGVPTASSVVLRAATGQDTTGGIEVDVPKNRIARRNLYLDHRVALDSAATSPPADSNAVLQPVLTGWVRTEDGVPVAGARVGIFGSSVVAISNEDGAFQLAGIHAGTQTLTTRAIGFLPDQRAVDLTDRRIPVIVGLTSLRRFLDTVRVRANRVSVTSAVGFDDRRKLGSGRFFTADEIERLHPRELTDLLRHASSLELHTDNSHNVTIRMRGYFQPCTPAIFVDGKQLVNWELSDLNGIVQPDQIAGMELYTPSMTPAEFRSKQGCGTVVVWTRASQRPPGRR